MAADDQSRRSNRQEQRPLWPFDPWSRWSPWLCLLAGVLIGPVFGFAPWLFVVVAMLSVVMGFLSDG